MREAFIKLVNKHQGILYKVSRMYRDTFEDQEDLYQEILLQLWKSYPKFRNESKVSTWMYRIALNTALASFRKRKPAIEYRERISESLSYHERSESSENKDQLFESLRNLNDVEKAIISLYLEGYQHKEIGNILGLTQNNIGVKMSRIKTKLKKIIK